MRHTRSRFFALITALAAACGGGAHDGPNLVVITVDTFRADRIGCYGNEDDLTPNIDRFAEGSVVFTSAFSTSSFTPPSHASIMTSQYVSQHGLLSWNELADEKLTLAEILASVGYDTAAFVNLGLLTNQNLGQGFDQQTEKWRRGNVIVDEALAFMREERRAPFFVWVHLYDVHRPYGGPAPWMREHGVEREGGVMPGDDQEKDYGLQAHQIEERGFSSDDLEYIAQRYDVGVEYLDHILAPLLEELALAEHAAETMVVLTSDHGENLLDYEGWYFAHDPYLYPEVTQVPMMMRFPGGEWAGEHNDGLVSLVDVAPTALGVLGLPEPDGFSGASLLPGLVGAAWPNPHVFMECWGWRKLKAIYTKDELVVYDMERQKQEFRPVKAGGASTAEPTTEAQKALWSRLQEFVDNPAAQAERPELDQATRERLQKLGYFGGAESEEED
jgi:arylsulfatase